MRERPSTAAGSACSQRRRCGSRAPRRPANGGRPATAGRCPAEALVRERRRRARHPEHRRHRSTPAAIRSSSRSARTAARASPAISPPTPWRCRSRPMRERWDATRGQDPLFAARRRPQLPAPAGRRSRRRTRCCSTRGLIRVVLPWPPRDARRRAARPASSRSRSCATRRAATRIPCTGSRQRDADGLRLSPAASRREHEVPDARRTSASARSSRRAACRPSAIPTRACRRA